MCLPSMFIWRKTEVNRSNFEALDGKSKKPFVFKAVEKKTKRNIKIGPRIYQWNENKDIENVIQNS